MIVVAEEMVQASVTVKVDGKPDVVKAGERKFAMLDSKTDIAKLVTYANMEHTRRCQTVVRNALTAKYGGGVAKPRKVVERESV